MKQAARDPMRSLRTALLLVGIGCTASALIACDAVTGPGESPSDVLIPATERAASIVWSSASRELVYGVVAGNEIRAVDYHTGARRVVLPSGGGGSALPRNLRVVGADVFYLFLPSGTDVPELRRQSLSGGVPETVLSGDFDRGFEISPDGERVLTVVGANRVLSVVDPPSGIARPLVDGALGNSAHDQRMWWSPSGSTLVAVLGAAVESPTRVAVVDVADGRVIRSTIAAGDAPTPGQPMQIIWPDGYTPTWIGERGGALVAVDLRTAVSTDLGPVSTEPYLAGTLVVSADGQRMAYWRGRCVETKRSPFGSTSCVKNEVEVVSDRIGGDSPSIAYAATGTGYPALSNVGRPRFSPDGRYLMIAQEGGIGVLALP